VRERRRARSQHISRTYTAISMNMLRTHEKGMTLVEMLVYTTLFVIIAGSVVYTLIALGGAYRSLQSSQAISSSAQVALERMTRDIRSSTSVDLGVSTLGSSPGTLQLNTLDINGNPTTVRFSVSGDVLRVSEAGVDQGPLTVASAEVTSLVFRRIATLKSEAVKIEMTIGSGEGPAHAEKTFYSTVVLRGSYPAN
jgi:Tfp pilus assembly protein PilW